MMYPGPGPGVQGPQPPQEPSWSPTWWDREEEPRMATGEPYGHPGGLGRSEDGQGTLTERDRRRITFYVQYATRRELE